MCTFEMTLFFLLYYSMMEDGNYLCEGMEMMKVGRVEEENVHI
jgi:hypothetical protein